MRLAPVAPTVRVPLAYGLLALLLVGCGGEHTDAVADTDPVGPTEEVCDGVDNDQDGRIDEGMYFAAPDMDGDGYAVEGAAKWHTCADVTNGDLFIVDRSADCDDQHAAVHPGAVDDPEFCDGLDNDCMGGAADAELLAPDIDGDGWASEAFSLPRCRAPSDWLPLSQAADCDDSRPDVSPDGIDSPTVCDGLDNDCAGDAADQVVMTVDVDGDGFGSLRDSWLRCEAPEGAFLLRPPYDCAPDDPEVSPDQFDLCGEDRNCDGEVSGTWPVDQDGDGYTVEMPVCTEPDLLATTSLGTDPRDDNADVYPGAPERCDGYRNDCTGSSDCETSNHVEWDADGRQCILVDADGDGLGSDIVATDGVGVRNSLDLDDTRYDPVSPGCPAFSGIRGPHTRWIQGHPWYDRKVVGLETEGGVTRLAIVTTGRCMGPLDLEESYECRDGALWLTRRDETLYRYVEDGAHSRHEVDSADSFTYSPALLVLPPDDAWGHTFQLETTQTVCRRPNASSGCVESTTSTRTYTVRADEGPYPVRSWHLGFLLAATESVIVTNTGDDDWGDDTGDDLWYLWGNGYTVIDPMCLNAYTY